MQDEEKIGKPKATLKKQDQILSESESDDTSEDDEEVNANSKKKGKGKAKGQKNIKKKDKDVGGLPRKQFKRLIKKEMSKQCKGIFESLMGCKDIGAPSGSESEQINSASNEPSAVVHERVECDGCGVVPITGVRYKCSICKNFDYCSICEARRGHEHAFLKIMKPN